MPARFRSKEDTDHRGRRAARAAKHVRLPTPPARGGPEVDRLPAAIWVAAAVDFLTAAGLFVLGLCALQQLGESQVAAKEVAAETGLAVAGAWLFLRLGRGLLDCAPLARVAQFVVAGLACGATIWVVLAIGGQLDLLGQELSSRAALGAVIVHLLGLLALVTPGAAERFRT